jgi:hypothetical protein
MGYFWGMNPVKLHYVRHEVFSRQDLHLQSLYWEIGGQSSAHWMELGEPRRGDKRYVLFAVQETVPHIPLNLSAIGSKTQTDRIHGQRCKESLDQTIVDKIVRVESNDEGPWKGFAFAIREQREAHADTQKAKHQIPTENQGESPG